MILEEIKQIQLQPKNLKHYLALGYKGNNKDSIMVKNSDIPEGSHVLENRKCDVCGKITERTHRSWVDTNKAFSQDLCPDCARKIMQENRKNTCLEKYGVKYPMQNKSIKEKAKQTTLLHYGCEFSFQNTKVRQKAQDNFKDKMSDLNFVNQRAEKTKATNRQKYGVDNVFQLEEIKVKSKQTNLERYGYEFISQSPIIQQKASQTLQEHYGVEHALQNKEIFEKVKQTCLERFGTEFAMQNPEIKSKANKTLSENGNVNTSKQQMILYSSLQELFPDPFVALNVPYGPCCLDIEFVKDNVKIDIEYDGWYWHQDKQKDRKRDEFLKTQGYKILRIQSSKLLPSNEELCDKINDLIKSDYSFANIILPDWKS